MTTYYNGGRTAKANDPMYRTGKKLKTVASKLSIDISEATDGDVYVIAEGLTANSRIHRIMAPGGIEAFDAAADNDIGFYYMKDGALTAADADILVDGVDLTTATPCLDLLSKNTSLNRYSSVGDLLSLNSDSIYTEVYLCLTINTKETTTDKTIDLDIVIEESTIG